MAMLHTVNKSPFERRTLDSCLRHATDGSSILLLEDGVYGAVKGSVVDTKIQNALNNFSVYALGPDIRARGMAEDQIIDGVTIIDYHGFVDLVANHDNIQAWL